MLQLFLCKESGRVCFPSISRVIDRSRMRVGCPVLKVVRGDFGSLLFFISHFAIPVDYGGQGKKFYLHSEKRGKGDLILFPLFL